MPSMMLAWCPKRYSHVQGMNLHGTRGSHHFVLIAHTDSIVAFMPSTMLACCFTPYSDAQGINSHDIGGGHPSVIIADIDSTAALMKAAREAPPSSFYHSTNLLLYLDEPNMGLQLDPRVYPVVREIMANAPFTATLASATLLNDICF
eukprot:1161252-Pelagomonas_calceolata.AAC.10